MKALLTPTQKEYLIKIAQGKFNEDIAIMMNARFGSKLTTNQIKNYKIRNKITSNMIHSGARNCRKLLTSHQDKFLRNNNFGHTSAELAKMLNEEFGLNISKNQIKAYRQNNSLPKSGLTGIFTKGHIPKNKGKKIPGTGNRTSFKKGHIAKSHPIGATIATSDGYIWQKISEPNVWKAKHILIWESIHGPKPPMSAIVFLDQNKTNFNPENLACISLKTLGMANQKKLLFKDAEISKAGIAIAKVLVKISERKSEKQGDKNDRD